MASHNRRLPLARRGFQQPPRASWRYRVKLGLGCMALAVLWCVTLVVHSDGTEQEPLQHDLRLVRGSFIQTFGDSEDSNSAVDLSTSGPALVPEYGGHADERVAPLTTPTISPTTPTVSQSVETERSPAPSSIQQAEAQPPPLLSIAPALTPMLTPETTVPTTSDPPTTTPTPTATTPRPVPPREQCYYERDLGLIERAATPTHVFCTDAANTTEQSTNELVSPQTHITLVDAPAGIRAVVFQHLVLDLTSAAAHRPIYSLAQDGGDHDPRFPFTPQMVRCACDAFHAFATSNQSDMSVKWNVWDPALAFETPQDKSDSSLYCSSAVGPIRAPDIDFPGRVLLMPRRDDHNPFFQVSNALNAWIMLRAFGWDLHNVTLIHLDDGYPSPIDQLHEKLLTPARSIVRGKEVIGKRLQFSGEVMLAPFESIGPMMQHLDDEEPGYASQLFRTFREESLAVLDVVTPPHDAIVVTIISRKPYSGRVVQRRWLNEDEIVARLRAQYTNISGKPVVIQSIEFVELPAQRQMQLMHESDVVVSMHGAGLVNVLWTRPGTLVVEIFPKRRFRWGYRNLCQHLGCDWHEFRGGTDTGMGDNASNKIISYTDWFAFFDPLFRSHVEKITTPRL